ncbi:MAG: hypothetical protein OET79_16295, partial [Nitrospirota bacterium]|nr:hypothetical protein [Nitrospirota bacterium]
TTHCRRPSFPPVMSGKPLVLLFWLLVIVASVLLSWLAKACEEAEARQDERGGRTPKIDHGGDDSEISVQRDGPGGRGRVDGENDVEDGDNTDRGDGDQPGDK